MEYSVGKNVENIFYLYVPTYTLLLLLILY